MGKAAQMIWLALGLIVVFIVATFLMLDGVGQLQRRLEQMQPEAPPPTVAPTPTPRRRGRPHR